MMLKIEDNVIYLTRGDTAVLNIQIVDLEGELYELEEGDKCEFTLKKYTSNTKSLIKKEIIRDRLEIMPEDTKNLKFGEYVYDIQLTLKDGEVLTIVPPTPFNILEEVNFE